MNGKISRQVNCIEFEWVFWWCCCRWLLLTETLSSTSPLAHKHEHIGHRPMSFIMKIYTRRVCINNHSESTILFAIVIAKRAEIAMAPQTHSIVAANSRTKANQKTIAENNRYWLHDYWVTAAMRCFTHNAKWERVTMRWMQRSERKPFRCVYVGNIYEWRVYIFNSWICWMAVDHCFEIN